jgi:uncharacterized protein YdeI (YjbR/CyaY-like superfamily)
LKNYTKLTTMNTNPKVDAFLSEKNHPLTDEIQEVREIILSTDERIEETIKWSSPTFVYKGNMASFFMNAKKFVSLMFHYGAYIEVDNGLLIGDAKQGRSARFEDKEDIKNKKEALQEVVREWIRMQDEED